MHQKSRRHTKLDSHSSFMSSLDDVLRHSVYASALSLVSALIRSWALLAAWDEATKAAKGSGPDGCERFVRTIKLLKNERLECFISLV